MLGPLPDPPIDLLEVGSFDTAPLADPPAIACVQQCPSFPPRRPSRTGSSAPKRSASAIAIRHCRIPARDIESRQAFDAFDVLADAAARTGTEDEAAAVGAILGKSLRAGLVDPAERHSAALAGLIGFDQAPLLERIRRHQRVALVSGLIMFDVMPPRHSNHILR